jgi:hypothetical protein
MAMERWSVSFNQFVGASEQYLRHREAERFGALEFDDQLVLGGNSKRNPFVPIGTKIVYDLTPSEKSLSASVVISKGSKMQEKYTYGFGVRQQEQSRSQLSASPGVVGPPQEEQRSKSRPRSKPHSSPFA